MSLAVENFYKVLEWYDRPYGRVPKVVLLGYAETDDDKILYTLPEPPKKRSELLNHNKPREKQVWVRHELPDFWSEEFLEQEAEEKFGGRKEWWQTEATPKMRRYANREWNRREKGLWMFIGGEPTYITGAHYFYLQWFEIDIGYPDYRDRDRRWYYVWANAVDDFFCAGLVYLKHRRDGATFRCCAELLEFTSKHRRVMSAIQSKNEEHARDIIYYEMIVPAYESLPAFFKPETPGSTKPKKMLVFDNTPARGKDKWKRAKRDGLKSRIKPFPKKREGSPFDGAKAHRFLRDEAGKEEDEDILKTWGIVLPAMKDARLPGKALWPSTVEEITSRNESQFETMWDDSAPSQRKMNVTKQTTSNMIRYFTPAYDGLDEFWIDQYGKPVIDAPTEEQYAYLSKKYPHYKEFYDRGGSYQYLIDQRASKRTPNSLSEYKRKYPFTPDEAFRPSAKACLFNVEHIARMLDYLETPNPNGTGLKWHSITKRGNLEWIDGVFKGLVRFDPDPNGRFIFSYMPSHDKPDQYGNQLNQVIRKGPRQKVMEKFGFCHPDRWAFVIGTDPIVHNKDHASTNNLSMAGAHGFWRYDPIVDGGKSGDETQEGYSRDWKTHSFIFEYLARPDIVKTYFEDMLKAAFFLGAKIHVENDKPGLANYFVDAGCVGFLLNRPRSTYGVSASSKKPVIGTPSSELMHQTGTTHWQEFIQLHGYPHRCPFPRTLRQLLKMDLAKMTKWDLCVSGMYALTAAKPFKVENQNGKDDITPSPYGKRYKL